LSEQANNDSDDLADNPADKLSDSSTQISTPHISADSSADSSVAFEDSSSLAQTSLSEDLLNVEAGDSKETEDLKHSAPAQAPTAATGEEESKDA